MEGCHWSALWKFDVLSGERDVSPTGGCYCISHQLPRHCPLGPESHHTFLPMLPEKLRFSIIELPCA